MPEALANQHGYVEKEYFLSGEAVAYAGSGEWGTDGVWSVTAAERAPYTTRMLVRRPKDPSKFDGTVLVEWLNVSSGQEVDAVFSQAHAELLSHGTVWVGVSAQKQGVEGGAPTIPVPGVTATPLKSWDPARYGQLSHPGDDFSYDIFSQASAALTSPVGEDPLEGLPVQQLIAAGESQSAARMVTYVNAIHPMVEAYDAFLIHSRSRGGAIIHSNPPAQPPFAWVRGDLDVPVMQFETESDLFGLPFIEARQPDSDLIRTWEVAGTAHLDQGLVDYRISAAKPWDPPGGNALADQCGQPNSGPQGPVLRKAIAALRQWALAGVPPSHGTPLEVSDGTIARDENGLALGGIRTPPVDAPTATLRGDNLPDLGYICALFGSTIPFDGATLARLYPTHAGYVEKVTRSAGEALEKGFLLDPDAQAFVEAAEQSKVGE